MAELSPQIPEGKKTVQQALAWSAHAYTALGLVAAAGIAVLLVRGDVESVRWAFVLMLVATCIDATDGTLARRVRVKEVLPGFDGRRLDDLIDFLTYTCLPLLLIWRADILPGAQAWWLLVPLLASAYGFSQVSAKTDDGYFLGFPSCWNVVAFYFYVLHLPEWIALALLLFFSLLTFVPSRYLYLTQPGRLNRVTNILGIFWIGLLIWILIDLPTDVVESTQFSLNRLLVLLSLFFPVHYLIVSWWVSARKWGQQDTASFRKEVTTEI